jgi:hypothetical protein
MRKPPRKDLALAASEIEKYQARCPGTCGYWGPEDTSATGLTCGRGPAACCGSGGGDPA